VRFGERLPHQLDGPIQPFPAGQAVQLVDARSRASQPLGDQVPGRGDEQPVA
jgi:hypothetical protein